LREREKTMSEYVVIFGNMASAKSPVEYVAHIVYGNPEIRAVLVSSKFVAICEFEDGSNAAGYTVDRMGSFPHGARLFKTLDEAEHEFGRWVSHYAPRRECAACGD
jgi:hypothetical protein